MMWGPFVALLWAYSHQPAAPERCTLRVAGSGIYLDGDPTTREQAVAKCKRTSGAVVIVATDAPSGAWPELRSRLEHERITFMLRGEVNDDGDCFHNPLAPGCY